MVEKMSLAIVSNGLKPVPDVRGGAVEHLTTTLIEQNEYAGVFNIDVFTLSDENLNKIHYKYTSIFDVYNHQKILPIRIIFSIFNRVCKLFRIKKHIYYMEIAIPRRVKKKYDFILIENSIFIFNELYKRYQNSNLIFHLHNDFDTISYDYDKTLFNIKEVVRKARLIITASEYLKKHILEKIDTNNVKTLENCVDKGLFIVNDENIKKAEMLKKELGIGNDDFVFLFCGRLGREKGALEMLRAALLVSKKIKIKIMLIGEMWFGSKEERMYGRLLEKEIEKLGESIIRVGYVELMNLPVYYLACNVVVVPSQCNEAFGMTALEAITMGKPCIVSACGGLMDIIDDDCGLFVDLDENYVENLEKSMLEYAENKSKYVSACENAKYKSKKFLNDGDYFEKFVSFCKELEV